jgi:hypothetical protein
MAATHHGFNILKIPGANGTITVRCNEKDALRPVEHVYHEAATMFPADEDLLEHSGDLTRKKQLAGCMAALGCFVARSGEKALPFFKLMKHTGKFEWTLEADKAFAELKRYLTSPPIMVAPTTREPLLLYIVATPRTTSVVLVTERDAKVIAKVNPPGQGAPREEEAASPPVPPEEPPAASSPSKPPSQSDAPKPPKEEPPEGIVKVQKPVYFVSTVLRDAWERYTK